MQASIIGNPNDSISEKKAIHQSRLKLIIMYRFLLGINKLYF